MFMFGLSIAAAASAGTRGGMRVACLDPRAVPADVAAAPVMLPAARPGEGAGEGGDGVEGEGEGEGWEGLRLQRLSPHPSPRPNPRPVGNKKPLAPNLSQHASLYPHVATETVQYAYPGWHPHPQFGR